ncbi:tape measure protein [Novosphingobium sp. 9]|uniref:tape measure protein n=1 Tax=Novosphingobium sp. 9 TaxID=2025349 RepID=UPI0021B66DEA|nr:tape measure protein [Novosphingobium sp. 9]
MRQSTGVISSSVKGLAASIGAGLSVREIANLADGYTRFTNSLKVAGLEGQNLAKTQNDLYEIAQKYGTELDSVGTLYSRISASAKDLGLSQSQLLEFVSGTSAALKVSGQSATEASGALLQLLQALSGSTIQPTHASDTQAAGGCMIRRPAIDVRALAGAAAP